MTEKDINQHLKNGISEIAPDCLDEIMEKIASKEDIPNPVITTKKWPNKKVVSYIATIAACFTIMAGSYGFYQYDQQKIATIVELDVNPSIEFCVDKADRVVDVTALNGDGEEVIENLSLKKENIEEATLTVMDELVERGFITKEKSTVLVSVGNKDEDKTEEIKESLSQEIVTHLEKEDIKVKVLKQTIVEDEISENIAREYNISKGKAMLIKTVVEENSDLNEEQLAHMTVDEIAKQAEQGNVNLNKLFKKNDGSIELSKEKDNKKEVTATKTPTNASGGDKKKKEISNQISAGKETPTNASGNNKKEQASKIPDGDKKKQQTKETDGDKKKQPTKTPDGDKKGQPTKTPDDGKKGQPTKAPDGDKKGQPTKVPDNNKKEQPTKTPDGDKKVQPTQIPDDDKKGQPTKTPDGDRKGKPTKIPDDDRKGKPTQIPDGDRKGKPTQTPENDDGKQPKDPDDNEKTKPTKTPDNSDRENGKNQDKGKGEL